MSGRASEFWTDVENDTYLRDVRALKQDIEFICKGAFLWRIFRFTEISRHVPAVRYT